MAMPLSQTKIFSLLPDILWNLQALVYTNLNLVLSADSLSKLYTVLLLLTNSGDFLVYDFSLKNAFIEI